MSQWLTDPITFTPPADARGKIRSLRDTVHLVVYGASWMPTARSTLMAAVAARGALGTTASVLLIDAAHYQEWYAENNLLVGVPCVQLYFSGKKVRLRGVNQSKAPACAPMVLANIYVGPMTLAGIVAVVESAARQLLVPSTDREGLMVDIDLGTVCAA